ncbi:MAG: hypothetical protein CSA42_00350 [Gammaproteobacteria bacterium]|nr:MAG: hypothetical protein CSB21_00050 [Deltaproteobacteria bacterium]PIE48138.1 MAG: hypothetical protein CSA42_00350 [Gammaproteobacteria bacterium]
MTHTQKTSSDKPFRRSRLGKKIKRMTKKNFPVFASIPPGFLDPAEKEIKTRLEHAGNIHKTKGGISFNTDFEGIIKANILTGIPTRILVRIAKFNSQNFDTLQKYMEEIPFELFLYKGKDLNIKVSSRKSRLIHTGAIKEKAGESINRRLSLNESLETDLIKENPNIFIRISRDRVSVSIDSSGEPLYKRGLKKFVNEAPLRENLCMAAILKSGYNKKQPFFDPMCGSGTFSAEAAILSTNTPPGIFRNYSFQNWPLFSRFKNKDIYKELKKNISPPKSIIYSSDISLKNVKAASENLKKTHLEKAVKRACINFFDIYPQCKEGTIAINPPYGIRLDKDKKLFEKIGLKLTKDFKNWNLVFILPVNIKSRYFSEKNFDTSFFIHGGIDMALFTGKI